MTPEPALPDGEPAAFETPAAAGSCAAAAFQEGDLVTLGPLVLPEHRGKPAVVTKVAATSCTVAVLDDKRRVALGECWPGLGDLSLESRKGRLGTRVMVLGLQASSTSWCNGLTGRVAKHPLEGHPCFIRKSGLPGTPVLVLCIELDPGQGARQKRVLLEPRFVVPCQPGPAAAPPPPEPSGGGCADTPAPVPAAAAAEQASMRDDGAGRPAGKRQPGIRHSVVRFYDDFYAPFLYGTPPTRCWMFITILGLDVLMVLATAAYVGAPLIALKIQSARAFHAFTVCLLAVQMWMTACYPDGEPQLAGACGRLRRGCPAGAKAPPSLRGLAARLTEARDGCLQGLSVDAWMWQMVIQVGVLHMPQLHTAVQLLAAVATAWRGQLCLAPALLAASLLGTLLWVAVWWQPAATRAALRGGCGPGVQAAADGGVWPGLWPFGGFGCRVIASNVEFADGLRLDVYGGTRGPPRGLLLWVHGGAWVCSCRGPNALARALAGAHGWIVCNCDYRPCRIEAGVGLQQQLADLATAAAWLRAHAADFGAEGLPLCMGGVSAGAHLAALSCAEIAPAALLLSSGFYHLEPAAFARRPALLHALRRDVLGTGNAAAWRAASPDVVLPRLGGGAPPPTALLHGTADTIASVEESRLLRSALEAANPDTANIFYLEVPQGPHGWDFLVNPVVAEVASAVHTFFAKTVLKGGDSPCGTTPRACLAESARGG